MFRKYARIVSCILASFTFCNKQTKKTVYWFQFVALDTFLRDGNAPTGSCHPGCCLRPIFFEHYPGILSNPSSTPQLTTSD